MCQVLVKEMEMSKKVFIIEHPRNNIDVSKAKDFGQIVYLFDKDDRRCSAWDHKKFGRTVLGRLKELDYNPEEDYICIVGAVLIIINSIIAIAQNHETFTVLLFNSIEGVYIPKLFKKG